MHTRTHDARPLVLFLEDERALQRLVSSALSAEGFRVQSALDGEDGLRLIRNSRPDAILLDLILPKRDGFSVLAELKEERLLADIPAIVLTNLESSADMRRAYALGAVTYLVKANYTLSEIVEKVKGCLRQKWETEKESD